MTWQLLLILTIIYTIILYWMTKQSWQLRTFVWGAFGQAYLLLQFALLIHFIDVLAALEAQNIQSLASLINIDISIFESTTLLVPDNQGWVSMTIGLESSTLIEMAVFSGLVMHYPSFNLKRRVTSLIIGLVLTHLLNLVRLMIIVLMVVVWGRAAFVWGHTLVGRMIYFGGVILLYWYLLTKPTIRRVHQSVRSRE